jgi:hypothetical protein
MKRKSVLLFAFVGTVIGVLISASVSYAQSYLVGTWEVQGSDFTELGLNLSGGTNPLLVVENSGSVYLAHLNQDVFVSEINCTVPASLNILTITPVSATDLNVEAAYPLPFVCQTASKQYEILVSNLAADNNSFTTCRVTNASDCLSWVRFGTTPPWSGQACSKSVRPSPPTTKVKGKTAIITAASTDTGVKGYTFQLLSKANVARKTIRLTVTSKKPKITERNLTSGTWGVRVSESCQSKGASQYSSYTGFTIK